MQPALAPELYYLSNFLTALRWISERYDDLLSAAERDFIISFIGLPTASQALLARLLLRKGPHFRHSALNYPEIGCCARAAEPLIQHGWLRTDLPLNISELCGLLRRAELATVFSGHFPLRGLTKTAMQEELQIRHDELRPFSDWCPELDDPLYSLVVGSLCDTLRLIFFGNLRQDWSEFVLAELGILRYETVPLDPASRGFACRADIEAHLCLHQAREAFEAGAMITDVLNLISGLEPTSPLLVTRLGKFRFQLARQLEREGELDAALELYAQSQYPGARQRQIRILETSGRPEQALGLVEQALHAPESDTEEQLVQRAHQHILRQLGNPVPPRAKAQESRIDLVLPNAQGMVEWAVRDHLHEDQAPVHFVENALVNSLFGLLCWEAIFAPLPGAFFHPFHSEPADLYSPDFRARRREHFDACMAKLDSDAYRTTIRRNWHDKQGIQSPFVFWNLLDEALLEHALACLPSAHLRIWFERLLLDIRANRCGMPDLIQFWPGEKRYRMIEVKGPGDRLQDNQRRWLALCAQNRMPVEVCYVRWAEP